MHENSDNIMQLLIIFATAVICVPLAIKLRLGAIIGYLLGGMIIGPSALNLVTDIHTIHYMAEFGIVFLLFIIGIEMKPSRLWTMRRAVLGLGGAQILVTGLVFSAVAFAFKVPPATALIIGLGLALSSTAMGLQLLADNKELPTNVGRTSFSILLMQDLVVPILLSLVTVLASPTGAVSGNIFKGLAEGVGILLLTFAFSRIALKPILAQIAKARVTEVFTAFALLLVLGMAMLMEMMGLSLAMGAFLAGMFLADSEYRHQIEADIQPFRGLLLGLFFMGVGMTVDFALFTEKWALILGLVFGLMATKALLLFALLRSFRHSKKDSLKVSAFLCQAGEFGFVLFAFAAAEGVLPQQLQSILMVTIALSMALTPFIIPLALKATSKLGQGDTGETLDHTSIQDEGSTKGTYIIAGFGRVGQTVALQIKNAGFDYIAFDTSLEKVKKARDQGYNVFFGDASRLEVLRAAKADNSVGLILTMDDRKAQMNVLKQIKSYYPDLHLHARAHDVQEASELMRQGARASVPETMEASLQLGLCALSHHPDVEEKQLELFKQSIGKIRDNNYEEIESIFDTSRP